MSILDEFLLEWNALPPEATYDEYRTEFTRIKLNLIRKYGLREWKLTASKLMKEKRNANNS